VIGRLPRATNPELERSQSLQRLLCVQENECRSDCPLEEAQKNYALFSKYVRRQRASPTITSLITPIGLTTIERIPFQRESTRPSYHLMEKPILRIKDRIAGEAEQRDPVLRTAASSVDNSTLVAGTSKTP
jgi:hypothetical protein